MRSLLMLLPLLLIAGTALWTLLTKWILERTGSALPRVMMKRLGWA